MHRSLLIVALSVGGCVRTTADGDEGGGGVERCDQDRYFCKEEDDLVLDPSCAVEEPLVVEVGTGLVEFEPLAEGEAPRLQMGPAGGFQGGGGGGQHVLVGLRIEGVRTDVDQQLAVQLGIFHVATCPEVANGDPCGGAPDHGERIVLLGSGPPLEVVEAGVVEEWALTFVVEGLTAIGDGNYVLQAIVRDPCGREGVGQHRF